MEMPSEMHSSLMLSGDHAESVGKSDVGDEVRLEVTGKLLSKSQSKEGWTLSLEVSEVKSLADVTPEEAEHLSEDELDTKMKKQYDRNLKKSGRS